MSNIDIAHQTRPEHWPWLSLNLNWFEVSIWFILVPGRRIFVRKPFRYLPEIYWCLWASNFTLTVPLSTLEYKWVAANLLLGLTLDGLVSLSGESKIKILLVASCYWNFDEISRWSDRATPYRLSSFIVVGCGLRIASCGLRVAGFIKMSRQKCAKCKIIKEETWYTSEPKNT